MNQVTDNPFPRSEDHKRYYTYNYYLKQTYGYKLAKIPLNAGFTCPNRDGTKSTGGCLFCSARGSGDSIEAFASTLADQYDAGLARAQKKWPEVPGIAYFQSYSNTYAPLPVLQKIFTPFLKREDVAAVAIATRPDCLEPETIAWLAGQDKEVWIELGLQSIHEKTMNALNRQHSTQEVADKVALLKEAGIPVCLHIINGLPGESKEDMLATARWVADIHPDALKIHMLHVVADAPLAKVYEKNPFPLLSQEEYVDIVCDQLALLPDDIIIERVTGDGLKDDLIAPLWTLRKTAVINDIDKALVARNSWQGKNYPK